MNAKLQLIAGIVTLSTAVTLQAGTVAANLSIKPDIEKATYVISVDGTHMTCSAFPDGRQAEKIKLSNITEVAWREPEDWTAAWGLFVQHKFEEAAPALKAVYENYKGIKTYKDSFSARAKFYECESLRLSGQYAALLDAYEEVIDVKLSEHLTAQVKLFNCWGHAGKGLWAPLSRIMEDYEVKEIPAYTVAPTGMPFKVVSPREIIQIAYLRGHTIHQLLGKKRADLAALIAKNDERDLQTIASLRDEVTKDEMIALEDYCRAISVSYGDEELITRDSMTHFLELITSVEGFSENYVAQKEAHAMAILLRDLFGGGELDSKFKPLLEEPKAPE
jgi:hypothetical protein